MMLFQCVGEMSGHAQLQENALLVSVGELISTIGGG